MSAELTLDIIRQMPKAELHCHLDGFCRPQTIIELAAEQGIALPTTNIDELSKMMTAPLDCPDLVTYLTCFDIVLPVMQQPYAITRIFYEACEDAVKDGITYIELRFAPALHTKNGHSYSQILEAAIDGVNMAQKRLPITPRIICCAMRQMSPEINREIAEICWRFRHQFVVGFDLAGPEDGFPPDKHEEAFRIIREKSLSVTIHAGEATGARSVELALHCNAHRIGHGTRIIEDERVLQEAIDRRVPLECCVTSNVQTKAVAKLEDHPIRKYFDMGVTTVPCTDNPTVSGCTLSGEYYMLHKKFNFNVAEILRMADYGFRGAFVPESMKKRLRIEAFVKSLKVLKENGIDISSIEADAEYYHKLGLTVPPAFVPPVRNPPLTLALIQQLPKCDLDCRFIGSVPIPLLFKFYQDLPDDKRAKLPKFANASEMRDYMCSKDDETYRTRAKTLATKLLQTEDNIRTGLRGILEEAHADNVVYIEVTISPIFHIKGGLTMEQVVDICIDEANKFGRLEVKFVINANIQSLSPIDVHKLAKLAVAYKEKGVVGFATTTMEITERTMQYYQETFTYLRDNFMPVTMFAGEENLDSVPCALVRGGARRIAGGFKLTQSESILNDVTSHNVAVLFHLSQRFNQAAGWKKTPVRFFFDLGVKVAFCSIHHSLANQTRSQQLMQIAEESGLDALSMLQIIDNSFVSIFLHYEDTRKYRKLFWEKTEEILKDCGFKSFFNYSFFSEPK
ncbi:adenosine deaminase family protein [Tritrichomonas foetus]|uniref:adenosine deaminase n=1 Tax=Tritrichomonas foetus TaxID=1144522 RepID=A0A1J4K8I7_9EUKA|nr:adenosine deaminase family protein [Tritrichomonas foetus]|eukprot:OHT07523.1 adenosine deaminase family protein [Tritrichomonas foetus]